MTIQKESLEARQNAMRNRVVKRNEALANRPFCISCNRRKSREDSVYCSRCTASGMVENLRDTLPGLPKEVMPRALNKSPMYPTLDTPKSDVTIQTSNMLTPPSPAEKIYTRSDAAKIIGVSPTTLMRWERGGKIPQPRKLAYGNQCAYTDEIVKAAQAYKESYYQPEHVVVPVTPGTPDQLRQTSRAIKIDRRIEKTVARKLGSLGRLLR